MVYKNKSLSGKKLNNKKYSKERKNADTKKQPEIKSKEASRKNIREKFTEILELPKEIVLNMPKLTMLGTGDLIIENYKGIVEYDEGFIRVNTASGLIKVSGTGIIIKEITIESILIYGDISSLEFIKVG